jgi:hypothetical protein
MNDYNKKKDFNVKWIDNKGKEHNTKIRNKFVSAKEAADYIYQNRKTCAKYPEAWWI